MGSESFVSYPLMIYLTAHETDVPLSREGKFPLGCTVTTPPALAGVPSAEMLTALFRHQQGDWGDVCEHDRLENEAALREGFRLHSVFQTKAGVNFWIITESDRSVTTVLLPEDY